MSISSSSLLFNHEIVTTGVFNITFVMIIIEETMLHLYHTNYLYFRGGGGGGVLIRTNAVFINILTLPQHLIYMNAQSLQIRTTFLTTLIFCCNYMKGSIEVGQYLCLLFIVNYLKIGRNYESNKEC